MDLRKKKDIPGVKIAFLSDPNIVIFSVIDHIPLIHLSRAEDALRELVQKGHRRIVIDLSAANRISSNGVGIAVYYHIVLAQRNGKLVIVKAPESVMKRIWNFVQPAIPLADTVEDAIAILQGHELLGVRTT